MTTRNFILVLTFLLSLAGAHAQEKIWTLQECVDYAALNNPDITYRQLADKQASVTLREAYGAYQPTISASTAHNYGNQPYGDPEHRYTGSYGVSANWTLWNASRDDQIDLAKEQKTSATASVKEQMNAVTEKVIKAYTQILYDDESVKINEEMLRLTESQTNLAKEKFNAGQTAIADYAQMESELSNRRYSVVAARNAARSDRLNLCELMFLPLDWNLQVDSVAIDEERILAPLPTWENVFENAAKTRPEIHIASLNVEQAQTQTKVAKANYMPSVQMGANVGTSNMEKSDTRFGEQLKDNWSNSVGVSVNVPILSGYSTKAKVAKAKIALEEAKTNAAVAEKTLRQTVQTYWLAADNARQSYTAAKEKARSARISYELVAEQYEAGLKTPTDLLSAHAALIEARQQLLQAKYQAYLNINLLRFYAGESVF